jgi:hypothetical protein
MNSNVQYWENINPSYHKESGKNMVNIVTAMLFCVFYKNGEIDMIKTLRNAPFRASFVIIIDAGSNSYKFRAIISGQCVNYINNLLF